MDRIQEQFHRLGFCDVWTLRKQGLHPFKVQALQHIVHAYQSCDTDTQTYIRHLYRRSHEQCIVIFVFRCIASLPSCGEQACWNALAALIIQDRRPDQRDWARLLERLYSAAQLHLTDPDKIFNEMAALASSEAAALIRRQVTRINHPAQNISRNADPNLPE
jgi:hypothetical protein